MGALESRKAAGGFQFVNISKPSDARKHRKQVRVQAALRGLYGDEGPPKEGRQSKERSPDRAATPDQWDAALIPWTSAHSTGPGPATILNPAVSDPFGSWVRPLSPFEDFLLKYFVENIVITNLSAFPFAATYDLGPGHAQTPQISWTQSAAMDIGMLAIIFLVASRDLSRRQHAEIYAPVAARYKAECLQLLSLAIEAEGMYMSEATITKTLALAAEELFHGQKPVADKHLQAAAYMINARGRPFRVSMWQHSDNLHMWTHWPEIMAGLDSHTICEYAQAAILQHLQENAGKLGNPFHGVDLSAAGFSPLNWPPRMT